MLAMVLFVRTMYHAVIEQNSRMSATETIVMKRLKPRALMNG